MYPGADEVALTQLARATTNYYNDNVKIRVIYRNTTTKDYIPAYEGLPLDESVRNQINAAGGEVSD
jgi:hypothetical protein